ncbi:stage V sporulation protein AB [Brassicibacter mesophilus]|uniref:stage V sporulation protein AB n=1 Tax=Brassicibacter mesophilus TaxID=745119 RepID=UPI003D259B31
MILNFVLATVALSGGVIVGSAAAAFVTLLDIVPRLAQLTDSAKQITLYEKVIVISMSFASFMTLLHKTIKINHLILVPIGLILGVFIGMLASALAEVLNVMPVLVRRFNMYGYIYPVLLSIALGKVVGSLISWSIIAKH